MLKNTKCFLGCFGNQWEGDERIASTVKVHPVVSDRGALCINGLVAVEMKTNSGMKCLNFVLPERLLTLTGDTVPAEQIKRLLDSVPAQSSDFEPISLFLDEQEVI